MQPLKLPPYPVKLSKKGDKSYIWDVLRKKHVVLTPEEWVRQHFVHFLINHKNYPKGLLANEVQVELNGIKRRCDTILYASDFRPRVIVEYKAPEVSITQQVFDQISRYNIALHVDYLIVSNGLQHYCCKVDYVEQRCIFLRDIPHYTAL